MRRFTISVTTIVALILAAIPAVAADGSSCSLTRYADIDITIMGGGRGLLIPVTIEGTPARAQLDLKNEFNMTTPGVSEKHSFDVRRVRGRATVSTSAGDITQYARQISVTIGRVNLTLDALLYPRNAGFGSKDIILGMSAFTHVDMELDLANGKLYLYSQDHCEGDVVYWADTYGRVPLMEGQYGSFLVMELDGQKIETAIETAGTTWLEEIVLQQLYGFDPGDLGALEDSDLFMSLTTDGIEVMGTNIAIRDSLGSRSSCRLQTRRGRDRVAGYTGCGNRFPLHLGVDVLQKMRIFFAMEEKMMYFTAADSIGAIPQEAPTILTIPVLECCE